MILRFIRNLFDKFLFLESRQNIYRAHKENATRRAWVSKHSENVPELLTGLQILSLQDMESYYSFHPPLLSWHHYISARHNTGKGIGNYAGFEMSTASIVEIKLSRPNRNPSSRLPCSHGFLCVTLCPFGNAPVLAKSINHTPTLSSS